MPKPLSNEIWIYFYQMKFGTFDDDVSNRQIIAKFTAILDMRCFRSFDHSTRCCTGFGRTALARGTAPLRTAGTGSLGRAARVRCSAVGLRRSRIAPAALHSSGHSLNRTDFH